MVLILIAIMVVVLVVVVALVILVVSTVVTTAPPMPDASTRPDQQRGENKYGKVPHPAPGDKITNCIPGHNILHLRRHGKNTAPD